MSRELRNRVLVTLGCVLAALALRVIPFPGVDLRRLASALTEGRLVISPVLSVGSLTWRSYVAASVIVILIRLLGGRGADVRGRSLERGTLVLALGLTLVEGATRGVALSRMGSPPGEWLLVPAPVFVALTALSMAAGLLAWIVLAHLISRRGVGNGLCVLVGTEFAYLFYRGVLGSWATPGSSLHEQWPAAAVLLGAALGLAGVWIRACWTAPGSGGEVLRVRVNMVGTVGWSLAWLLLGLPGIVAQLAVKPPGWMEALGTDRPLGAVLFLALAGGLGWLFTAWATGPLAGRASDDDPAVPSSRPAGTVLPFASALVAPVGALLFSWAAPRVGLAEVSPIALALLAAVTLDTAESVRAHRRMASALAPAVPEAEDGAEPDSCAACGSPIAAGDDFCRACGAAFEGASGCAAHVGIPAVGRCVVCGRTLCTDCARGGGARFVCAEHDWMRFVEGWAVTARYETPAEGERARRALEAAGVEGAVLVRTLAPIYGSLGLFDFTPVVPLLPYSALGGGGVQVLVRPADHARAVAALVPLEAAIAAEAVPA